TAAFAHWLLFSACHGNGATAHCAFYRTTAEPGTVTLVKDIEPDTLIAPGPTPSQMALLNGVAYFVADDGIHGVEPWRSDGPPQGTRLVKDIVEGIHGSDAGIRAGFTAVGQHVFFDAGANRDNLWRTDGTPTGTKLVRDIDTRGEAPGRPGSRRSVMYW